MSLRPSSSREAATSSSASSTRAPEYLTPRLTFVSDHTFNQLVLPPLPDPVPDTDPVARFTVGGSWTGEFRIPSRCSSTGGDRSQKYAPSWVFEAKAPKDKFIGIRIQRSTLISSSVPVQGEATARDDDDNLVTAPFADTGGAVWGHSEQGRAEVSEDRRVMAFSGIGFNDNVSGDAPIASFTIAGTITCAEAMPADLPTSWEQVPW